MIRVALAGTWIPAVMPLLALSPSVVTSVALHLIVLTESSATIRVSVAFSPNWIGEVALSIVTFRSSRVAVVPSLIFTILPF